MSSDLTLQNTLKSSTFGANHTRTRCNGISKRRNCHKQSKFECKKENFAAKRNCSSSSFKNWTQKHFSFVLLLFYCNSDNAMDKYRIVFHIWSGNMLLTLSSNETKSNENELPWRLKAMLKEAGKSCISVRISFNSIIVSCIFVSQMNLKLRWRPNMENESTSVHRHLSIGAAASTSSSLASHDWGH